jgi:transketolase N-terminal domain/subunit
MNALDLLLEGDHKQLLQHAVSNANNYGAHLEILRWDGESVVVTMTDEDQYDGEQWEATVSVAGELNGNVILSVADSEGTQLCGSSGKALFSILYA